VLVAPPDRHLLALDGRVRLDVGPKENGHRPAVDVTFRSVAEAYGRRAIGVVLSGTRFDGAAGLGEIVAGGGRALVQDPTDSLFDGMPRSALRHVEVDAVLPVAELARRLEELCGAMGELSDEEEQQMTGQTAPEPAGERRSEDGTRYTCPDCGGVLFHDEGVNGVPRFVCSVGHAYLPEALDDEQARMVEGALWTAARMLGDRATYLREMAERMRGATSTTDFFRSRAEEAEARQRVLLDLMDQAR
jgi:two-component system chemotaxis response regulator CheB